MSNKLTRFLSNTKRKTQQPAAVNKEEFPPHEQLASVSEAIESQPTVALDVVQPKVGARKNHVDKLQVLEQWGVAEDEELVDDVEGAAVKAPVAAAELSDDEDEIDLPSSKVRGNFEWGRKQEEQAAKASSSETAEPDEDEVARKRTEAQFGLKLKKKKAKAAVTDLGDSQEYPDLMAAVITKPKPAKQSLGDMLRHRHAATEAAKLKEEEDLLQAASSVLIDLAPTWPENWPKSSPDESAIRSRYAARILPVPRLVMA